MIFSFVSKLKNYLKKVLSFSRLGDGLMGRSIFIFYYFFLSFKRIVGLKRSFKNYKKLKLRFLGKSFPFYIKRQIDFSVLKEIFITKEYDINLSSRPKIIVDIGSNIGASVIYFRIKYPEAKIFAFEPDPYNFEQLKMNTRAFDNIFLFQKVISSKGGQIKFYASKDYHLSSSIFLRSGVSQQEIEVESITLDDLIKDEGCIDLLKFDVEGAEYEIFKNCSCLDKIKYLIGEVHLSLFRKSLEEFLSIFGTDFDYKILYQGKNGTRFIILFENKNYVV